MRSNWREAATSSGAATALPSDSAATTTDDACIIHPGTLLIGAFVDSFASYMHGRLCFLRSGRPQARCMLAILGVILPPILADIYGI